MENVEEKKEGKSLNFIESIVEEDLKVNKSICLNFGLAQKYKGKTNLRFDDTNPLTESEEYVNSIREDVRWLGFEWKKECFASDYFDQLYEWAVLLVKKGKAYVCEMSAEEISASRGTPTQPGKESPWRNRAVEENLDLFERMKNGEFPDGSKVLRAKIDMASPNMHLRDPALYRIKHAHHHRTGNKWCIYPMYDWAHGQSDYMEGITHSICTLEFEVHRPLYDWFLDEILGDKKNEYRPRQIEFARLNLNYTVMSKRKLLQLVQEGYVNGWDDPRLPTISGLRRRGYTPEAMRIFSEKIGVAKRDGIVDLALLEHTIREDLNKKAPRVMAVLNPLKVVLSNYPAEKEEWLEAENNPEDSSAGTREIPFSREIYIEQDDFREDPPKKFFRLSPGNEVRLKNAYIIKCERVEKDGQGNIIEIHCSYDPETRSGSVQRKVKGTLHWVSAKHALPAEVRLYDRLFTVEDPSADKEKDFKEFLNEESLVVVKHCQVEPSLQMANPGDRFQFQRIGYFSVDLKDSTRENLVFNRTVPLRDSWAKIDKQNGQLL